MLWDHFASGDYALQPFSLDHSLLDILQAIFIRLIVYRLKYRYLSF